MKIGNNFLTPNVDKRTLLNLTKIKDTEDNKELFSSGGKYLDLIGDLYYGIIMPNALLYFKHNDQILNYTCSCINIDIDTETLVDFISYKNRYDIIIFDIFDVNDKIRIRFYFKDNTEKHRLSIINDVLDCDSGDVSIGKSK